MAANLDLQVQRNAMLGRTLSFTDREGDPLDLTGATFDLGIRYSAGASGDRVASGVVNIIDAALGQVSVSINGANFGAVPGAMEIVVLAYDLIAIQGGDRMALMRGSLILIPGVS